MSHLLNFFELLIIKNASSVSNINSKFSTKYLTVSVNINQYENTQYFNIERENYRKREKIIEF